MIFLNIFCPNKAWHHQKNNPLINCCKTEVWYVQNQLQSGNGLNEFLYKTLRSWHKINSRLRSSLLILIRGFGSLCHRASKYGILIFVDCKILMILSNAGLTAQWRICLLQGWKVRLCSLNLVRICQSVCPTWHAWTRYMVDHTTSKCFIHNSQHTTWPTIGKMMAGCINWIRELVRMRNYMNDMLLT